MPYAMPVDIAYIQSKSPHSRTALQIVGSRSRDDEAGHIYARGAELLQESKPSLREVGLNENDRAIAEWIVGSARRYPNRAVFERSTPTAQDRRQFEQWVALWKGDIHFTSSTTKMSEHPAYRAILRMGYVAVPLLLRTLQREPNQCILALKEITGADPVPVADRGRLHAMTEAWLRWGRAHGITW